MAESPYIAHVTLSTGHIRRSPRSEVGDDALAVLVPWLVSARAAGSIPTPLPGEAFAGFTAKILVEHGALVCTVYGPASKFLGLAGMPEAQDGVPLVTFGVAQRSRHSKALWAALIAVSDVRPKCDMPEAPWCGVVLHPTLPAFPDASEWMGDFERCVAWAWISRNTYLESVS